MWPAPVRSDSGWARRNGGGRHDAVRGTGRESGRHRGLAGRCTRGEQVREALRRLKRKVEAGETPTVEGQPEAGAAARSVRPGNRMKAVCWRGRTTSEVETVPDPEILNPRDAIVRVTSTAICGSDLHLYDGFIPDDAARRHPRPRVHGRGRRGRPRRHATSKVGDRVVVPFTIACGGCFFCKQRALVALRQLQPQRLDGREAVRLLAGRACSATRTCYGGYAGGQAEYVRVPFADVGPFKVPDGLDRRAGAVPLRHLSDRLHGGGELQHPARRHRRRLGLRPGRPVRDRERVSARRRAGDRHRQRPGAARAWRARRCSAETLNFDEDDVLDGARSE